LFPVRFSASRRRHTRSKRDWSSDVCSSDLVLPRTYIEADEFDDLRTSARYYAEQLAAAGVEVEYEVRRGVTHGHLNKIGLPQAAESRDRMAALLQEL